MSMFVSIAVPGGNISTEMLDGKQAQNKSTKHTTSLSVLMYFNLSCGSQEMQERVRN